MGARDRVENMLNGSPMAGHLSASDGHTVSGDLTEIGTYLEEMVEDLRTLHEAVLEIAESVDNLAGAAADRASVS